MRCDNEQRYVEWRENLDALEEKLCLDIVQNRQAVMRERIMLDYETEVITKEEAVERLIEALELTVSIEKCLKAKEWYWTIEEINLLYNIEELYNTKKKNMYQKLLLKYCSLEFNDSSFINRLDVYETIATALANRLGNDAKYELSNKMGNAVIQQCLRQRRMRTLARGMYSVCWNNLKSGAVLKNSSYVNVTLNRCILISEILRHKKLVEFFVAKVN